MWKGYHIACEIHFSKDINVINGGRYNVINGKGAHTNYVHHQNIVFLCLKTEIWALTTLVSNQNKSTPKKELLLT